MTRAPRGRSRAGIITLLTDFGSIDPYVGTMKGVVLGINPRATLVDLTHGITPQAIRQGALALDAAWPFFPTGTVHVAVVDPGVGSERAPLAVQAGGHTFIGPDNGLFSSILRRFPEAQVRRIDAPAYRLARVSRTFHGRDIFAPAAAWISRGVPIEALGPVHPSPVLPAFSGPLQSGSGWTGEVTYIDVFGNLVTNLPAAAVESEVGMDRWEVRIAGRRVPLSQTYADVPTGTPVALVGSFEVVEIAVNCGSAREVLEAGVGAPVALVRRS